MKTNKCFNISVSTIGNFMQIPEFSGHISQSVKEIPVAWMIVVYKQQRVENPAPARVDWLCFLFTLISSDCLRAGRSGDRILVGARFSAPVLTGPEAHPVSCTMGTDSFPGVNCGGGVTLTPHPFLVPKSKME
jgi:hypothetical protein